MSNKRRYIIPEVIQTSEMDCGPASLKSLLEGFNIHANYGRLREACQTDVDGTSIDTIEELAVDLGMNAEQIMIPADHLLLDEAKALPALVVIELPNRATHFVVVWRVHGDYVQLMDPGKGRHWRHKQSLLEELYQHAMPVPAEGWMEWASSDEFILPLRERMAKMKLAEAEISSLVNQSRQDENWQHLAALDASVRMSQSLVDANGIRKGSEANHTLTQLWQRACEDPTSIPSHYWNVQPCEPDDDGDPQLMLHGAVMIRFQGMALDTEQEDSEENQEEKIRPPSLDAILSDPPPRPLHALFKLIRKDSTALPWVIFFAIIAASVGILFEALLLRGFLDIGRELGLIEHRMTAVALLLVFISALLLIEVPIAASLIRMGRHLEMRLRLALLEKIPKLSDRFFHSRPTSDTAERGHSLHHLRQLPMLGEAILTPVLSLLFTTAGIIWLDPASAIPAMLAAASALCVPFFTQTLLFERDMQVRTHEGALSHFYLDALTGLTALRTHSAQNAVFNEHEGLLSEWARASFGLQFMVMLAEGIQLFTGFALAAWLLFNHFGHINNTGTVLLLVYWALNLPVLGQQLAAAARQYPQVRNHFLRVLEPLSTPEEGIYSDSNSPLQDTNSSLKKGRATKDVSKKESLIKGVHIQCENLSIRAAGHTILNEIDLSIEAGEHIAIVGPSGAGKSSLISILLGWHTPSGGDLKIDGNIFKPEHLTALRKQTVWVDPAVQLWNRSLIDNLAYGADTKKPLPFAQVIDAANLQELLQTLPEGLQSSLGEGGGLLSGGEGQRVRLARGMLKPEARLIILDEPFRGLERPRRKALLESAKKRWPEATLLYVSHDIEDALTFDRVLVIEDGSIAEQGKPCDLESQSESRFHQLLKADHDVHRNMWADQQWTRLHLQDGQLEVLP